MKKTFALLLASLLLFSAFAATAEGKELVTVRFYNYALSETAKADWWKDTIASFEAKNPWVTVECITVDYNSMIQTFTNDLGSGMSVDLILGAPNNCTSGNTPSQGRNTPGSPLSPCF